MKVNDKRIRRICQKKSIKSTIKYANNGCTRHAKNAQFLAENILNRNFHADNLNEKYILYYNTQRVQRNLDILTPMEKHTMLLAA